MLRSAPGGEVERGGNENDANRAAKHAVQVLHAIYEFKVALLHAPAQQTRPASAAQRARCSMGRHPRVGAPRLLMRWYSGDARYFANSASQSS